MYPNGILNMEIIPPQLGRGFLDFLRVLIAERLKDKDEGRKVEANAKKVGINGIYGKMGFRGSWVYYLEGMYKMTLNGQFYIIMLVERLLERGIWVFYSNTDGITVLCKRSQEQEYYDICKEWEKEVNWELEFVEYEKCIIKDVNNYIIQKKGGGLKRKGKFLNPDNHLESLKKALFYPVCAKAITNYFIDGKKVSESLREIYDNGKGIYDFCTAAKVSSDFQVLHEDITKEMWTPISEKTGKPLKPRLRVVVNQEETIQNSIRYYVSNTGKRLRKKRVSGAKGVIGRYVEVVAGFNTHLFNDYSEQHPEPNWEYYEDHCYKIIRSFKEVKL